MFFAGRTSPYCSRHVLAFASGQETSRNVKIRFNIKQKLDFGHQLAVVGSSHQLGSWNVSNTTGKLSWSEGDFWKGEAEIPTGPVEFKLVVVGDGDAVNWQPGENVALLVPDSADAIDVTGEESSLNLTILEASTTIEESNVQNATGNGEDGEAESTREYEELSLPWLKSLKVTELKNMCTERGLPVSGKKSDLIDRLTNV